jgi:FixJ family two-component response regulator
MPLSPHIQSDAGRPQVLLVHADDATRRSLQLLLNGWGFEVRAFSAATSALVDSHAAKADILLVDDQLTAGETGTMLAALRRTGWGGRAILMSHSSGEALNNMSTLAGFAAIVRNPPREVELRAALSR